MESVSLGVGLVMKLKGRLWKTKEDEETGPGLKFVEGDLMGGHPV
jgi:hypothetical protein